MTIPRASTGAHTPAAQSGTAPLVRSCPDERLALGTALPASRGHRGASHMSVPRPPRVPQTPHDPFPARAILRAPAAAGLVAVESDRPADRARVIAWALKRWHWRGAADASDQPDPDNRTLQMGRRAKDPRAVQQEARAGPPSGQRIAERSLARWETHPTQTGRSVVMLTQAVSSAPAGRSVAARIPHRTRLVKPPRRRQPDSRTRHRARVLRRLE